MSAPTEAATALEADALARIEAAETVAALEAERVAILGKKGSLTQALAGMKDMAPEDRKTAGQAFNAVKQTVAAALEARKSALEAAELDARLASEKIDITLPVRPSREGRIHPISQTLEEMVAIFAEMGFTVAEGPDIETDFNNFTALNIPPEHPARQMHDTFYLPDAPDGSQRVLRTHTSPVQVRTMLSHDLVKDGPIRIVAPGRTYRSDYDMTHTPMFHQIEGLVIGRNIHMGHLKGCLEEFARTFFQVDDLPLRFRPSFFPFTEPSAEVDIGCRRSGGELVLGPHGDWLEILGCGMVHPKVLSMCGIDPSEWQGFAFGMGIERPAMLKYGIPDLRTFFEADTRWLKHYGFLPLDIPNAAFGLTR